MCFFCRSLFPILLFSLGVFISSTVLASDIKQKCNIHKHSCSESLGQRVIEFDIVPKPVQAMKDLTFTVRVTGPTLPKKPYVDLSMPGMKMGPNQIKLKKTGKLIYEGKGVIVRCPSGKRLWKATVVLPELGEVSFLFDVIY